MYTGGLQLETRCLYFGQRDAEIGHSNWSFEKQTLIGNCKQLTNGR